VEMIVMTTLFLVAKNVIYLRVGGFL